MITDTNKKKNRCITCNKEFNKNDKTKPFCSKRCSYIDLNNWLEEKYLVIGDIEDYEKDN